MTKTTLSKAKIVFTCFFIISFCSHGQQCEVDHSLLKGTYTGDCKKNKAHGKGKAMGTDSYEGDFKNGMPDGQGIYTWANKDYYVGKYVKGFKEGKGKMTFKVDGRDSIIEGFWKKDVYIGKNEKPWEVYSKTGSVRDIEVEYTPEKVDRVKIIITNTTGSVTGLGGQIPPIRVDNLIIIKGGFQRQTSNDVHLKSTETIYLDVMFPFRVKLQMLREEIEMEFFEPGSYTVNISINN